MLQKHLKSHNEHKPFSCDICGKSFHFHWYLTTHKKTHAEEGTFGCVQCGKVFSKRGNLLSHAKCHVVDSAVNVKANESDLESSVLPNVTPGVEATL
jgi:KRAB domain-containing zinc finger protein